MGKRGKIECLINISSKFHMKEVPVIIFGAGGVGRELLKQIVNGRANTSSRNNLQFNIVAIADSKQWAKDVNGLSDEQILNIASAKLKREPIGEDRPDATGMIETLYEEGVRGAILVDITAVSSMEPTMARAIELGYGIVLANKKALAGPWETAAQFYNNPMVRHESTVGGGQPVIATMRYLLDTNDPVLEVSGQFSGTLGYIAQRMDEEEDFSAAVAEAKMKGYTEPDPREDLGGLDVMRKALILARMAGWELEQSDIEVESLYPSSMEHLSVPEFMQAVVALNGSVRDRFQAAAEEGNVLRYLAIVNEKGGKVGLSPMPKSSSTANLKFISFDTGNYHDENLMLIGKGAGVEMTAAGVVGDMIDLAREQL